MARRERNTRQFTTGVPGLDLITGTGPMLGGVYLVLGRPGAGKTILGNQMCFAHVASGKKALFVTLLTENHARMLNHLKVFEFFEPSKVGGALQYLSGYEALEKEQLPGLLTVIRKALRHTRASLLVIDGLVTAGAVAQSEVELKKFIHELQVVVELMGCTAFLLTGVKDEDDQYPVRTMVDGLIELSMRPLELGVARELEVLKLRGCAHLMGRHRFNITNAGLTLFPRIEASLGRSPRRPSLTGGPRSFGIKGLDSMLGGGGVQPGSVTLLLGASGAGKTVLGLSFLNEGARAQEPGLYLGFSETPTELQRNSRGWGPGFARHLKSEFLELLWQSPDEELIPDAVAAALLAKVKARKIRRVFIDGVAELQDWSFPRRSRGFFNALCNELRMLGVTTLLAEHTRDFLGPEIEIPHSGLAPLVDNIVLLRHVELSAKLRRFLSVVKTRAAHKDPSLREFTIDARGVEISTTFESAEAILTGAARLRGEGGKGGGS